MFSQLNPNDGQLNFLLLNQWLKTVSSFEVLPKPIPLYTTPDIVELTPIKSRQQSVIKSTKSLFENTVLPKCVPPKIVCQSTDEKSAKQLPEKTESKSTSKNSRLSYAREYKLMVIDYFVANGQNKYRTCKKFKITKSMLNGWLSKADKIANSRPGALKTGHSGRRPHCPDLEERLYKLYLDQKFQGHQIENRWLREAAHKLAKEHNLFGKHYQFSERWLNNFKRRYGISTCKSPLETQNSSNTWKILNDLKPLQQAQTFNCSVELAEQILSNHDQLPICTFYERFPWLCSKRNTASTMPSNQ
ncbi:hypothetical protein M3Y97_00366200 [Aphelenchoides bicaudatus]|nr:hypothetical protein M3Y97_00366200 [Aphelenchoides bicaudatus]